MKSKITFSLLTVFFTCTMFSISYSQEHTTLPKKPIIDQAHNNKDIGLITAQQKLKRLFKILLDKNISPAKRVDTIRELKKFNNPKVLPELIKALGDKNTAIRDCAYTIIRKIKSPDTVPLLIKELALPNKPLKFKHKAMHLLLNARDPSTIPTLINALEDSDIGVRTIALQALIDIKESAIPVLLKVSQKYPPSLKSIACTLVLCEMIICENVKDKTITPALIHALENYNNEFLHKKVLRSLSYLEDPVSAPILIKIAFDNKNEELAYLADSALRQIKDPGIIPYLITALKHVSPQARKDIVYILRDFGSKTTPHLQRILLKDNSPVVQETAAIVLGQQKNPQSISMLKNFLKTQKARPKVHAQVIEALGTLGNEQTISLLKSYLGKKTTPIVMRCSSASAIEKIIEKTRLKSFSAKQKQELYKYLHTIFKTAQSEDLAVSLLKAIAVFKNEPAKKFIEQILSANTSEKIRLAALYALSSNFKESAFNALVKAMTDDPSEQVRASSVACTMRMRVKDDTAIPVLKKVLLCDTSEHVRSQALYAIANRRKAFEQGAYKIFLTALAKEKSQRVRRSLMRLLRGHFNKLLAFARNALRGKKNHTSNTWNTIGDILFTARKIHYGNPEKYKRIISQVFQFDFISYMSSEEFKQALNQARLDSAKEPKTTNSRINTQIKLDDFMKFSLITATAHTFHRQNTPYSVSETKHMLITKTLQLEQAYNKIVYAKNRKTIEAIHEDFFNISSSSHRKSLQNYKHFQPAKHKSSVSEIQKIINNFLKEIEQSRNEPITIQFSTHGSANHMWLRKGYIGSEKSDNMDTPLAINYKQLAKSLIKRGNLENAVIVIDACFSYNFAVKLLTELTDLAQRAKQKTITLPTIITVANKNETGKASEYDGSYFDYALTEVIKEKSKQLNVKPYHIPTILGDFIKSQEECFWTQDPAIFISKTVSLEELIGNRKQAKLKNSDTLPVDVLKIYIPSDEIN